MKFITLITLVICSITSYSQPSDADVLRLLDTYEIIPGGQQTPASEMYPGEGMMITKGTFLVKNREEYLAVVPLVKGPKQSEFAFIGFEDDEGNWQRSAWYTIGFKGIDIVDLENDGVDELIHEVEYLGRKMTKNAYRIISVQDEEEAEIYKVEGFQLPADVMIVAKEGEHVSTIYEINLSDINEDGRKEIVQTITDKYHVFAFDNINLNQEYDENNEPILPGVQKRTTIYKLKNGELTEIKLKEKDLPSEE